jgi:hypothetical protein
VNFEGLHCSVQRMCACVCADAAHANSHAAAAAAAAGAGIHPQQQRRMWMGQHCAQQGARLRRAGGQPTSAAADWLCGRLARRALGEWQALSRCGS